jgi:hypothetical protein
MNFQRSKWGLAIAASATILLAACEPAETSTIRVLHTSPDAPAVNVYLDGEMDPTVESLDFAASSGFATVYAGETDVEVYGITPSGADTETAVISAGLDFDTDTRYTIVAVDSLADISAKVFADTGSLEDANKVRVQVAHLTDGVPEVYVHVTAPGATLSTTTALGSVSFTSGSDLLGPTEIAAGDYQIRISTDAAGSTVAYDSGTVSLAAGSDLFIGAIPNTSGIGDSPVALSVLSGEGASTIYDVDDGTAIRPVHTVSDVNAVDIGADADAGTGSNVSAFTNYQGVDFKGVGAYAEVAAGTYDVGVDATDNDVADILLDGAALSDGMSYTILAVGTLASDAYDLELVAYADDRRTIGTGAKVRIIHASTAAGEVDLYATATSDITGATPAFEDVPFKASTGYFEVAAGTYHFTAALAGTSTIGLASGAVPLEAGDIITIIARDLDSDDTETGDPVIKAIVIDETTY